MNNPLGEQVPQPSKYDPGILYPIPRWPARSLLDIDKKLRMFGLDHWNAYEISWLSPDTKPHVAMAEIFFDGDSENIVESKSLKLYLNSLNNEIFDSGEALSEVLENDLSAVSRSRVMVKLKQADAPPVWHSHQHASLDTVSLLPGGARPEPDMAILDTDDDAAFDECLVSDLFRSKCPVTGQPDWASVTIQYTGRKINSASLLTYLCSYREHQAYHEECAERIFRDISLGCEPAELLVAMNYLRRGGLDINVYRSSAPVSSDSVYQRGARQ